MPSITDQQMRMLRKFMTDSFYTHTDEWLQACVNWIQEENNRPFNFEFFKKELLEQWRDSNLIEMESACLPLNLKGQRLVKLTGKYGLQMNNVRDIGDSAYSQMKKIKKLENDNVLVAATDSNEYRPSWEPKASRCLYLSLTDGSQQIFGLEKQHIPALKLDMKPGCKILIIGPVDCRRGVLQLKPNNVKFIGGEVEQFLEDNNVETILAKQLEKATTSSNSQPQPQSWTNSNSSAASNSRPRATQIKNEVLTSSTVNSRREEVMGEFPDSEEGFPDMGDFGDGDEDDFLMQIDEEALIRSASASTSSSTSSTVPTAASTSTVSSSSRNIFDRTTQKVTQASSSSMRPTYSEEIEDFEDDPDFLTYPSQAASSKPAKSTLNTQKAAVSKPKAAFVPPPPKIAAVIKSPVPGSSFASGSGSSNSSRTKVTPTLPSSSSYKSQPVKSESLNLPGSFQSAKTALKNVKNSNNGNSSSTQGKQVNIMQYMKPMPVIIDPPTPERQAIKRRKKALAEGLIKSSLDSVQILPPVKQAKESPASEVLIDDDDDDFPPGSPSDDAFMQMIDETIENKLLECEDDDDETFIPRTSSQIKLSSLTGPTKPTPPSSVHAPQKKLSYPVKVPEEPYVFLMQVNQNFDDLLNLRKIVRVKACISTVVSNIRVESGCWVLSVSINDGTGFLDCDISPDILNDIIGFSPDEMKKIKAAKTPASKQQISAGMSNLSKKLVHLNAILAVEIGTPCKVIEIHDVLLHHKAAVKERLQEVGLK